MPLLDRLHLTCVAWSRPSPDLVKADAAYGDFELHGRVVTVGSTLIDGEWAYLAIGR